MGYSIMVQFSSRRRMDRMYNFLKENFKEWDKLAGVANRYSSGVLRGGELSYGGGRKWVVGFDYNASAAEGYYIWAVCVWMAKVTGKEYVLYDGEERMPLSEFSFDSEGFYRPSDSELAWMLVDYGEKMALVVPELRRLGKLWRERG